MSDNKRFFNVQRVDKRLVVACHKFVRQFVRSAAFALIATVRRIHPIIVCEISHKSHKFLVRAAVAVNKYQRRAFSHHGIMHIYTVDLDVIFFGIARNGRRDTRFFNFYEIVFAAFCSHCDKPRRNADNRSDKYDRDNYCRHFSFSIFFHTIMIQQFFLLSKRMTKKDGHLPAFVL